MSATHQAIVGRTPTCRPSPCPLANIDVSGLNTRKDLAAGGEDASVDDLARSIREQGLISPPVLRPGPNGRFDAVAGQRRLLACRQLGLKAIPAIVRDDLTDGGALALSLTENLQRADMSPLDKARAFQALRDRYGGIARGTPTGRTRASSTPGRSRA